MGKLVVVQAACELGLLEVRGYMLVGHLLEARLEEIDFFFFAPGAAAAC